MVCNIKVKYFLLFRRTKQSFHCLKSVRVRSFSGLCKSLHSVRMQENTDQKNTEYRNVIHSVFWHLKFHVRKKTYLGLMHKWHPLKIQNSKFKPFWDSLSPTLRHLRLKTPSWSITLNINLFLPRKKKTRTHAHIHTHTHTNKDHQRGPCQFPFYWLRLKIFWSHATYV